MRDKPDLRLTFGLTKEDRELLGRLAQAEDRDLSSMLRYLIRRAAAERGIANAPQRGAAAAAARGRQGDGATASIR